ncbi:MAG: N-acetylneuraminate synthase [Anaerolineales bacterium]|nr:N-acetylneuraminate synthase [Anaerolineales bacterium]
MNAREIKIGERWIGGSHPTYFVADIAANHDGDLERAKMLIKLAKEAGADAAKFQNFRAPNIVSDFGFKSLGGQLSHQAEWKKSVFEVYEDYSIDLDWTPILKEECDKVGIHYFSSPYDFEAADMLEAYVPAYKAGSGLMSWPEMLVYIAKKGKPLFVATGACDMSEVVRNVRAVLSENPDLILMQCNTNYTGSAENFDHIHLNVLKTYATVFPNVVLGLSDHTPGHATVLGAVAFGARAIEKHFTDDTSREGPDHGFAMDPDAWSQMVERTRELERALGSPDKRVADNEKDTVVLQRRCLRAARDIKADEKLTREMIDVLRPATPGAIEPYRIEDVIGTKALVDIPFGDALRWTDLRE